MSSHQLVGRAARDAARLRRAERERRAALVACIPLAALRTAEYWCLGYGVERIAVKRSLTPDTVRAHLAKVRTVLQVASNGDIFDFQELIEDRLTALVSTP